MCAHSRSFSLLWRMNWPAHTLPLRTHSVWPSWGGVIGQLILFPSPLTVYGPPEEDWLASSYSSPPHSQCMALLRRSDWPAHTLPLPTHSVWPSWGGLIGQLILFPCPLTVYGPPEEEWLASSYSSPAHSQCMALLRRINWPAHTLPLPTHSVWPSWGGVIGQLILFPCPLTVYGPPEEEWLASSYSSPAHSQCMALLRRSDWPAHTLPLPTHSVHPSWGGWIGQLILFLSPLTVYGPPEED